MHKIPNQHHHLRENQTPKVQSSNGIWKLGKDANRAWKACLQVLAPRMPKLASCASRGSADSDCDPMTAMAGPKIPFGDVKVESRRTSWPRWKSRVFLPDKFKGAESPEIGTPFGGSKILKGEPIASWGLPILSYGLPINIIGEAHFFIGTAQIIRWTTYKYYRGSPCLHVNIYIMI